MPLRTTGGARRNGGFIGLSWAVSVAILQVGAGVVRGLSVALWSSAHRWHCLLGSLSKRRPCRVATPRSCCNTPAYHRRPAKTALLLWLTLSPQALAVQVWQHGVMNGRPVFNTGNVPGTTDIHDIMPVRHSQANFLGTGPICRAQPTRDLGVYLPDAQVQPQLMHADDRLHGRELRLSILEAFGLRTQDWDCHRICESLPGLPAEQYVAFPRSTPWHVEYIPVDLRPCGGRVTLQLISRAVPCGFIACQAFTQQRIRVAPEGFLCRTSAGWFVPSAYVTLLPSGDAFQVWPVQRIQAAVIPVTDSLPETVTLEDRFATSLDSHRGVELAFHDTSGDNAVVLSETGLCYVRAPVFADHLSIRSVVLAQFGNLGGSGRDVTHFPRVLPPLDNLPAIQFVAVSHWGTEQPALVDLRALSGSIAVFICRYDATPLERARQAVQQVGEPDNAAPLESYLRTGRVSVLHREQLLDPFQPVRAGPPCPLVFVPRRSNVAAGVVGFEGTAHDVLLDDTMDRGSASEHSAARTAGQRLLPLLAFGAFARSSGGEGRFGAPAFVASLLLAVHLHLVGSVAWTVGLGVLSPEDLEALAPIQLHRRVVMGFYSQDASMPLHGPDIFRDAPATVLLHFQVWSPQTHWSALVPGDATYSTLHHALHALAAPQGRGIPVLRQPQGIARSIQLVSPASEKHLVTVLVDTGTAIDCVDVPRKGAGQALQEALQRLYPQSAFRLEVLPTQVLRHGDVIQAHRDEKRVFEVGAFLVPEVKHSERWLVGATEILITSVDLSVVRVRVPTRHTPDSLMAALQQCFGQQRCRGARLHRLSIRQRSLAIYCLSRGDQDTLTAVLSDVDEASGLILLTTIDGPRGEPLSVDWHRSRWVISGKMSLCVMLFVSEL